MIPFGLFFAFFSLVLIVVYPCAKFEVSRFNPSRDGSQNSKSGTPDLHMTPFDLIFCRFCIVLPVYNLFVKFDANIFIDDRKMAILRLRRFGCEMPIRANLGEFWGILTPKIVKLLFWPRLTLEVRSSLTRFEIVRVKIGSPVSSVSLVQI